MPALQGVINRSKHQTSCHNSSWCSAYSLYCLTCLRGLIWSQGMSSLLSSSPLLTHILKCTGRPLFKASLQARQQYGVVTTRAVLQ